MCVANGVALPALLAIFEFVFAQVVRAVDENVRSVVEGLLRVISSELEHPRAHEWAARAVGNLCASSIACHEIVVGGGARHLTSVLVSGNTPARIEAALAIQKL